MIDGYEGLEEIHRSTASWVLRGVRSRDGQRVVLKTTAERRPSDAQLAGFVRERRLVQKAQGDHVVRLLDVIDDDGAPVLVFDDFGGRSLDLGLPVLSFRQRLELACDIARCVDAVHRRGVIHKDINPSNLVWNRDAGTLVLIDFGLATDVRREVPSSDRPGLLEGTLRYIAPEQSGRLSCAVDRRADLYATGATLYELFCGKPPFENDDPLALVHAHVARLPKPLHEHDVAIPRVVSTVVMRLLEKAPERRYQTAGGMLADLERCARDLRTDGQLRVFDLGAEDRTGRIEPPRKLYGRTAAVGSLLDVFQRAAAGARELVLVSGSPGIGKTSLVREIYEPVATRNGELLEGKFDQLRLGVPYAPLAHAFGRFLRRVLTQDDERVAAWREKTNRAVGPNGAVLVEIMPELESLLGPQAPVQELGATEAENRIHLVFRELVGAIASAEHPIVLFLDDLQWADVPTLRLLERIVTHSDTHHVMVIGAYRDHEIDAAHPLRITLDNIRRSGVTPTSIELGPLTEPQVQSLVRDTLDQDGPDIVELGSLCSAKTGGNPFFLRSFLEALGERGVVVWQPTKRRWEWSLREIATLEHTDNVIELLLESLAGLPLEARAALQEAACIGDVFDLRLLSESVGRSAAALQTDLRPAIDTELVAPLGKGWILDAADDRASVPDEAFRYRFVHDRIHQAAYESMRSEDAERAHHRLGQLIARRHRADDDGAWLFEVVNHLNRAPSLATGADERIALAERNLEAGRRAMRAAAFGPAEVYFAAGIAMLPEAAWTTHYALALRLHTEAAECAYANTRFDLLAIRIAAVKENAKTVLDRIEALEIELEALVARADLKGAVRVALGALDQLGVRLPAEPGQAEVGAAVQRTMDVLAEISIDAIEKLPDVTDPAVAAAQRFLVRASAPAYFSAPALLPIIVCELVVASVRNGLSTSTPFGLSVYGIVLNSIGLITQAHEYGELAERLIDRWDDRRLAARTSMVVNNNVCTWTVPLQSKLEALRDAYRVGRDAGDFEYAAISAQSYSTNSFTAGSELGRLLEDAEMFAGFMRNYGQSSIARLHEPLLQLVRAFVGALPDPSRLDGHGFDEEETCALADASGSASLAFVTLSDALIARFHFGSAAESYRVAERARPFQHGAVSTYHLVNFHTYAPLAAARCHHSAGDGERTALLATIDESIAQLRKWADAGPMNHLHRQHVVCAERARIVGELAEAETLYHRALEAVRITPYINDEALIGELAARFYLARGGVHSSIGRAFLEDAAFAYQRWGAAKKVERLREEFPRLIGMRSAPSVDGSQSKSGSSPGLDIDAAAVVRAARTISAEIELDELLRTLFRTIVEAGGARKALLWLERDGAWEIAVEGSAGSAPTLVRRPLDALDPESHPLAVVRYVQRTGETVLIDDATLPGTLLDGNAYARAHEPRSVLCIPARHRGELIAMLYLEHDRAPGVFSAERTSLLDLLMSQAAVSIHNAQLFDAQVRLTRAQSRFVPHQFLESLEHRDIAGVTLGDAVAKTMSVFFSDLRDFTAMAERMPATTVIQLLNDYFAAMEPSIVDAGGFIDSFNGDEIMALFDVAPEHAVRAGVEMQAALSRFNVAHHRELRMGIGINTGDVVLGTVGGRDRIKCGVVGDAVNVASRIEGLTKRYGTPLLIGEHTRDVLPPSSFSLRPVDRVAVKGARRAIAIFEVLDAERPAERAAKERSRATLEDAMALYYARDFRHAAVSFVACREMAPFDRVPAIFVERCRQFEAEPPPDDWQGIDRLG